MGAKSKKKAKKKKAEEAPQARIRPEKAQRWGLVAVLVLAGGLRLGAALESRTSPFFEVQEADSQVYLRLARALAGEDVPADDAFFYVAPFYPHILSLSLVRPGMNWLLPRLLQAAAHTGCVTVSGVDMFIYQGAAQFELWTGFPAPVNVMRSVVLKAL